jgi:hypothetical protein
MALCGEEMLGSGKRSCERQKEREREEEEEVVLGGKLSGPLNEEGESIDGRCRLQRRRRRVPCSIRVL